MQPVLDLLDHELRVGACVLRVGDLGCFEQRRRERQEAQHAVAHDPSGDRATRWERLTELVEALPEQHVAGIGIEPSPLGDVILTLREQFGDGHVDASVAVRFASSAAALIARLSCGHAAGCVAEEVLAAHVVMQCSYDLQHAEEWAHLTDDERSRAVRALDGVFELFQDDEAVSLWGDVTAELTTPEDAIREVGG